VTLRVVSNPTNIASAQSVPVVPNNNDLAALYEEAKKKRANWSGIVSFTQDIVNEISAAFSVTGIKAEGTATQLRWFFQS